MLKSKILVSALAGMAMLALNGVGFAQTITGTPVVRPESSVSSAVKTTFADFRAVGRGIEVLLPGACPDASCPTADDCYCAAWAGTKLKRVKFNNNVFNAATLDTELTIDTSQQSLDGSAVCFGSSGVATIYLNPAQTRQIYLALLGNTCLSAPGQWFLSFQGSYSVTGGTFLIADAYGTGWVNALVSNDLGNSWARMPIDIRGTTVR